jgi:hypothetical protein
MVDCRFATHAGLRRPLRDVKNEATSGDVHENTGDDDKMSDELHDIYKENAANEACLTRTDRAFWPKMRELRDKSVERGILRVCRSAIILPAQHSDWAGTGLCGAERHASRTEPNSYSWRLQHATHSTICQKQMGFLICANMSWCVICFKSKEIICALRIGAKLGARRSTIYQNQNELAVIGENREKIYLIETRIVR